MSIIVGLILIAIGVVIGVTLTVVGIRQLCREGTYIMAKRTETNDETQTDTYRVLFNK